MNKKVIVFGATGLLGQQIVKENIKAGNQVTVYTRRQADEPDDVNAVTGELDDVGKIKITIERFDVIVSAVGNRDYNDPTMIVSPLTSLLSKSVKDSQRLIVVFGAGLMLLTKNTLMRDIDDHNEQLKYQRADHWEAFCNLLPLDINFLMICPTWVIPGDFDGNYLYQEIYFPKSDEFQVSAGNVGHFIAGEIKEQRFTKSRIGLVNA